MYKPSYKTVMVLFGLLLLIIGIEINYFSAEITDMFLSVGIPPLTKGISPYTMLQTECAETAIKIISVCADIGGILAIIYGLASKKKT